MLRAALTTAAAVLALGAAAGGAIAAQRRQRQAAQGKRDRSPRPGRLHHRDRQPVLADKPGSRWVYRETDSEGTKQKVVVTVTNRTKRIANGVTARVVRDVVTEKGKFVEVTDDWYAQDRRGNIWYLGEATTEYENGKPVSTAGSFEAGVDGAQAGRDHAGAPAPGPDLPPGVLQGRGGGQGAAS